MVTPYFLNLIAGSVMHSPSMTLPSNYFVALSTTVPAQDGTGFTEVTGGAYARGSMGTGSAPSDGVVSNSADVEFHECTADWGTVKAFGIYDAATGGNLLMYDKVTPNQSVVTGNQVRFKPSALKLTIRAV